MFELLPTEKRLFAELLRYKDYEIVGLTKWVENDVVEVLIYFQNSQDTLEMNGYLDLINGRFTLETTEELSYFEQMYCVSEFVIGLSKEFKTLGDFIESNRLKIVFEFDNGVKALSDFESFGYERAARSLKYNYHGQYVSGNLAEKFRKYAQSISYNQEKIREFFVKMDTYFDKYKIVNVETRYVYRNQLKTFAKHMLIRNAENFLDMTSDNINQFIKENESKSAVSVNNMARLALDFMKTMYNAEFENIQLREIVKKERKAYSMEDVVAGEKSLLYKIAKHRYFMKKLDFLYGINNPFISVGKLRDHIRNLLFYRLASEVVVGRLGDLINLTFNDFNAQKGTIFIKNKEIPLTHSTRTLLEEFKGFRETWDDFILLEKNWFAELKLRDVGGKPDPEAQWYWKHLKPEQKERLKTYNLLLLNIENSKTKGNEKELDKEFREISLNRAKFLSPILAKIEKEQGENKEFNANDYIFISNRTKLVEQDTFKKMLQQASQDREVSLTTEGLRYTRATFLTQELPGLTVNQLLTRKWKKGTNLDFFKTEIPFSMDDQELTSIFKGRLTQDLLDYEISKRNISGTKKEKEQEEQRIREELLPSMEKEVEVNFAFKRSDIFDVHYNPKVLYDLMAEEISNKNLEQLVNKWTKEDK